MSPACHLPRTNLSELCNLSSIHALLLFKTNVMVAIGMNTSLRLNVKAQGFSEAPENVVVNMDRRCDGKW